MQIENNNQYKGKLIKQMVDVETGEIKNVISYRTVEQAEGNDKRVNKNEIKRDYEAVAGRNFSFFKNDEVLKYLQYTDDKYLKVFGAVMVLSTYLPMNGEGKLPQKTQKEIAKILDISVIHTNNIIIMAQELNLMHKIDGYYLNTDIINRGVLKDTAGTVRSFHKALRVLKTDMRLQHIGFLFLILPFISFDHHVICKNPSESEIGDIEGMTMEELGKSTGLSKVTVGRKIKSMIFEYEGLTMSVFAYFINPVSGSKLIVVNPALFSRTISNKWKNIINLFIINR